MTVQAGSVDATTQPARVPPYSPSWVDRFTDWVDRLPIPVWSFYVLMAVVMVLVETAIQWREGAYAAGTFIFNHTWAFSFLVYEFAMIHILDRLAAKAIVTFRPLLESGEGEQGCEQDCFQELKYRLTTLPFWPAIWASLAGGGLVVMTYFAAVSSGVTPNYLVEVAPTPLSYAAFMLLFMPGNMLLGVLLYHTVHQLVIVNRIYTSYARINLYQLQPLYALSNLGAVTTLGLSAVVYIFWLTTPEGASTSGGTRPFEIILGGVFTLIAALTFVLPLWGAHRRIVDKKNERLAQASSRFEETTRQLHHELDSGDLEHMGNLNRALASLELEQETLRKIPT